MCKYFINLSKFSKVFDECIFAECPPEQKFWGFFIGPPPQFCFHRTLMCKGYLNVICQCIISISIRVGDKPHLELDSVARNPPPSPRRFVCVSVLQNKQSISSPSIGATNPNQEQRESLVGSGSCSGSEATLDRSPHTSRRPVCR